MTLIQSIHEQWSGYRPLAALIPPQRLYTGLPPIRDANGQTIAPPYVSISLVGEAEQTRTSSGTTLRTERVRFSIYAKSYDEGRRIGQAICDFFNRRDFAFAGGQALDMRSADRTEEENADDGVWRITQDFTVLILDKRGSNS
jgi:hypothetical protein